MMNASDATEPNRDRALLPLLKKIILTIGIACCVQFILFGIIGVVRGFSVQSWTPAWVLLIGVFIMLPFRQFSYLSSGMIIVLSLISINQGKYQTRGDDLYDQGQYTAAMSQYRKEVDTWYLRLRYNYNDGPSMLGLAKCCAQLGQFEKSRETYAKMVEIFHGYYGERADSELYQYSESLRKIKEYDTRLAQEADDDSKAATLFDLALIYRSMPCFQKAREQYQLIQDLDVRETMKEQARKFSDID